MNFRIDPIDTWQPAAFVELAALRRRLMAGIPGELPRSVDEYEGLLGSNRAFPVRNEWKGWLARSPEGTLLGGLVASRPFQNWPSDRFIPVGFFDCIDDAAVARALFDEAGKWAKERGFKEIRGPIQGNFFHSYRLRAPGGGEPFYGEPLCPDYYHRLFTDAGFEVGGRWHTIRVAFEAQRKRVEDALARPDRGPSPEGLSIRGLDARKWAEETALLHSMLHESFAQMPNFMPASLEEFREWYASFRHIVNPDLSYVVELQGRPFGFMIAYADPLPVLAKAYASRMPWRKLLALWRLKRLRGRILIPYGGKLPSGPTVKGVNALLLEHLISVVSRQPHDFYGCYLATDSPGYAAYPKEHDVHAEYLLYAKQLS
ncbi:MAG: hypothetical protein IT285_09730 [Bdellovibrionales bacterium]|nr:hypothetical protein [Bdellovibrionales bacterium]